MLRLRKKYMVFCMSEVDNKEGNRLGERDSGGMGRGWDRTMMRSRAQANDRARESSPPY